MEVLDEFEKGNDIETRKFIDFMVKYDSRDCKTKLTEEEENHLIEEIKWKFHLDKGKFSYYTETLHKQLEYHWYIYNIYFPGSDQFSLLPTWKNEEKGLPPAHPGSNSPKHHNTVQPLSKVVFLILYFLLLQSFVASRKKQNTQIRATWKSAFFLLRGALYNKSPSLFLDYSVEYM